MAESKETTREFDVSDESGFVSSATDASTPARNVDARPAEPHIGGRVGAQATEVEDFDIDKDLDSLKTPAEGYSGGALGKLQQAIAGNEKQIAELKDTMRHMMDCAAPDLIRQQVEHFMATHQQDIFADVMQRSVNAVLEPVHEKMDLLSQKIAKFERQLLQVPACCAASRLLNDNVAALKSDCQELFNALRATNTNVKANRLSLNNTNKQTQAKLSLHDEQLCRAQRQSVQALTLGARAAGQAVTATQGVGELRDQLSANAEFVVRVEVGLQETQALLRTTSITVNNLVNDYNQTSTHGGLQQARDEDPPDRAEVAPSTPQAPTIVTEPAAPARSADADSGGQGAAADGGAEDGVNPAVS